MPSTQSAFSVQKLDFYYGPTEKGTVKYQPGDRTPQRDGVDRSLRVWQVHFLRCLNRMNDTINGTRVDGEILLNGKNICDENMDVVTLRQRVEFSPTETMFTRPKQELTEAYITGKMG